MNIIDGRGKNKKKLGENNRKRVEEWIKDNPGRTKKDCCESLGLSYKTLKKHLASLGIE